MAHEDPAHAHGSADDEYGPTPEGSTYEHTDAHTSPIVKFLAWLAVATVLVVIAFGFIYGFMVRQMAEQGEARYPMATEQNDRLPPAPRLQQFPRNEMYEFRLSEQALLEGYGWMNREAGTVHIPIDVAMRLTVERGLLSSRPADASPAAVGPGMMPADSSAGRTFERRR